MAFFRRTSLTACLMASVCTITPMAAEIGPGVSSLSPGDTYAEYQWGLENDGSLQLVEIRSRFANGGSAYDAPRRRASLRPAHPHRSRGL